jgi:presenilin-like A22 family membrane protease
MKHTIRITIILVVLFFIAQVFGLFIINQYIDHEATEATGNVTAKDLYFGSMVVARPPSEGVIGYIIAGILIGTLLVLVLVKMKAVRLWKLWFFLSVWMLLTFAFNPLLTPRFAWIVAFILALWKVLRPSPIIHNATELFVYGGLGSLLVLIDGFKAWHALILLILISIYDMIAVWKIKHMITLAEFQTKSKMFAGLFIPYKRNKEEPAKRIKATKTEKIVPVEKAMHHAILGGGDIGFPLVFAGVVMKDLMLTNPQWIGFLKTLVIPFFVSVSLFILFYKSEKNKFYPAMPFLTIGCLVGYGIVLLL